MTEVFLERFFPQPMTEALAHAAAAEAGDCFDTHHVRWRQSLLSLDGHRMLCWFVSRDAESARIALRQAGADTTVLWPGTVYGSSAVTTGANVLVERFFPEPVTFEQIQRLEDEGRWCMENWRVRAVRTFFSYDRTRMRCMYIAPDAESVREAQRQANMPFEQIWACREVI